MRQADYRASIRAAAACAAGTDRGEPIARAVIEDLKERRITVPAPRRRAAGCAGGAADRARGGRPHPARLDRRGPRKADAEEPRRHGWRCCAAPASTTGAGAWCTPTVTPCSPARTL